MYDFIDNYKIIVDGKNNWVERKQIRGSWKQKTLIKWKCDGTNRSTALKKL